MRSSAWADMLEPEPELVGPEVGHVIVRLLPRLRVPSSPQRVGAGWEAATRRARAPVASTSASQSSYLRELVQPLGPAN